MTDLQMEEFGVRTTPPPHLKIKTLNLHRKKKSPFLPREKIWKCVLFCQIIKLSKSAIDLATTETPNDNIFSHLQFCVDEVQCFRPFIPNKCILV